MTAACEYPNCRESATTVIVIELGRLAAPRVVECLVCDTHLVRVKEITRQHDGIAYRVRKA
jgi:hypothetical protein